MQAQLDAINQRLGYLPAPYPVVFAAALAERLLPFAENSELARHAGVRAVLVGQLDRVWRHVYGISIIEIEADQLIQALIAIPNLGDAGDFDAVDACRAVHCAVRACCDQAHAIGVAEVATELANAGTTPRCSAAGETGPAAQLALLERVEDAAARGFHCDSQLRDVLTA